MVNDLIITQSKAKSHNGFVKLTGPSGPSVYADTLPVPTADNNSRDGWLYSKSSGTEKFNYYIYGQGSHPITLSQLHNVFFSGAVDNYINGASVPFVVVYTKPTGAGDAGAWYHSKVAYALGNNHLNNIQLGELCFFTCINQPKNIPNNYRNINLSNKIVTGDALGTEEILTISIQSDSGAANTTQILIQDAGFQTHDNRVSRNIKLVA